MACSSIIESSNSSSSLTQRRNYDVFISFRGKDTRYNFTDHLFGALQMNSINAFRDDKNLKIGESIAPDLLRAIEGSEIYIVIFSKNYATSKWCLQELEKIVDCVKVSGKSLLPIYYYVDASEVRYQKGSFGEAFKKHEERYEEEIVQRWREALSYVANISGPHIRDMSEYAEIQKIVQEIKDILGYKFSSFLPNDLVGTHTPIEELEKLLQLDSLDDVRVLGISGMGGIGKTTLATILYGRTTILPPPPPSPIKMASEELQEDAPMGEAIETDTVEDVAEDQTEDQQDLGFIETTMDAQVDDHMEEAIETDIVDEDMDDDTVPPRRLEQPAKAADVPSDDEVSTPEAKSYDAEHIGSPSKNEASSQPPEVKELQEKDPFAALKLLMEKRSKSSTLRRSSSTNSAVESTGTSKDQLINNLKEQILNVDLFETLRTNFDSRHAMQATLETLTYSDPDESLMKFLVAFKPLHASIIESINEERRIEEKLNDFTEYMVKETEKLETAQQLAIENDEALKQQTEKVATLEANISKWQDEIAELQSKIEGAQKEKEELATEVSSSEKEKNKQARAAIVHFEHIERVEDQIEGILEQKDRIETTLKHAKLAYVEMKANMKL